MSECRWIDALLTPYIDDDIGAADRDRVDRHLRACGLCRARVRAEQAVHALLCQRRSSFETEAPPTLRARCASLGAAPALSASRPMHWWARVVPVALAASLVLLVAGAFLYELTARSTTVMAAELAADHVKCFRVVNYLVSTQPDRARIEQAMASGFDWHVRLPEGGPAGFELVGARLCFYGEGRVAHIMYRHHGKPVSIFMLPTRARPRELVEVIGYQASIWSVGHRTFVLIASEPRDEVERMTSFVHSALR